MSLILQLCDVQLQYAAGAELYDLSQRQLETIIRLCGGAEAIAEATEQLDEMGNELRDAVDRNSSVPVTAGVSA